MTLQKILVALAAIALVAMAHRTYGWPGLAAALGAGVMWLMLHFTRLMTVLKRAANRPKAKNPNAFAGQITAGLR